ncbi:MAG: RNase adapter RapZ [Bacillota bacterium]|nr:RNase adapter RapZ [Bacillota bacterium]
MSFVIVTGISGAGKTQAIHCMEDMGYYCIDNLPPILIDKFADICRHSAGKLEKVALVMDLRGGYLFEQMETELQTLRKNGYEYEILFLDCSDDTLIKRYKETRRKHPLAGEGNVMEGIEKERELLAPIKAMSDHIVDTSNMPLSGLKKRLMNLYSAGSEQGTLEIEVESFGFKFGMALDADLVFDVRFLPNPFYEPELKHLNGTDKSVADYVFASEITKTFTDKLADMMDFLVPNYSDEGKTNLVIAIGCTGGRHRSVAIAEWLGCYLMKAGYKVNTSHRDKDKK